MSPEQAWEQQIAKARPNSRGIRQTTYPEAAKLALADWLTEHNRLRTPRPVGRPRKATIA